MSGLQVSPIASRYLMALSDKELADAIYGFLARLSLFPIGVWGEEPRTREEIFRNHRFVFRLVIDDEGLDVTSLEEIVPLNQ